MYTLGQRRFECVAKAYKRWSRKENPASEIRFVGSRRKYIKGTRNLLIFHMKLNNFVLQAPLSDHVIQPREIEF